MRYELLVTGLKGALFLEALPKALWPEKIYYYKVAGEVDEAHQRLISAVEKHSELVNPLQFQQPLGCNLVFALGWQYLLRDFSNLVVLHDSLLPRYRGFAPTVTALIRGEKKIGVTAILPNEEMDAGPIVAQHSVEIPPFTTAYRAFELIANSYVSCVRDVLEAGDDFRVNASNQNSEEATYSIWRDDEDFQVSWDRSAEEITRTINAVGYPYQGAKTCIDHRCLVLVRAEVRPNVSFEYRQVGKVWRIIDSNCADVICGSGLVRVWARWQDSVDSAVFTKIRTRMS